MDIQFDNIPQQLRDRRQWVLWHLGKPDEAGKRPKVPLVRESAHALTSHEWSKHASRWWNFENAAAILNSKKRCPIVNPNSKYTVEPAGVGIVLRHDVNPPGQILVAFDVDDHTPDHRLELVRDGKIHNPFARDLVERLDSYCEITPSGYGFRVLCLVPSLPPGIGPGVTEDVKFHNLSLEIFVGNKFITVTGNHATGSPTEIKLQSIDALAANLTFNSKTLSDPGGKPQRIESGRHNFLKKQAKKLVTACWIFDRELLVSCLVHLRDTWCKESETLPDREVEAIADWALLRCCPDPLWQGNDSYLAANLCGSDHKYAAAWRGDFSLFNGDWASAYNYVTDKLLRACGNDPDQTTRIYRSSPIYKIVESQVPDHIKNAAA
jgi:hypothetical protein